VRLVFEGCSSVLDKSEGGKRQRVDTDGLRLVNTPLWHSPLLDELDALQAHTGLSDRGLAGKLGVSNACLSHLKRGGVG